MNAPKFKIKKRVTLPVLQLKPGGDDRFIKIMTPMVLGEKLDDQKNAAMLMQAVDLVTGEYGLVIPPTIMQKELNKNYPDGSYVGKCFAVSVTRNSAKKYNHVTFSEVEEPEEVEAVDPADAADAAIASADGFVDTSGEASERADASDDVSTAATPIQSAGGRRRR